MGWLGRLAVIASIVLFILLSAAVLALNGLAAHELGQQLPPAKVRLLAKIFLERAYWPYDKYYTVMSPEAVTSIIWDFRGLDTLFETVVFYLAIIGSIAVMRDIEGRKVVEDVKRLGLSPIVKTVTRITVPMILAVAASIALHGHLTPGGGFQGGATAAVAPLLVLVIFSKYFLERLGVTKNAMLVVRSLGLIGIALTGFAVLIAAGGNAYVFQNQPKVYAPVGLPCEAAGMLISGTLLLFNIFEMFAVAAGFTIIFLLLAIPEREVLEFLKREVAEEGGGHG